MRAMATRVRQRWSEHDTYWGPFTIARDRGVFEVMVNSGTDEEYRGCHARLRGFGWAVLFALPNVVRPYREHTVYKGRDLYEDHNRRYGFYCFDGHFNVCYGAETNDGRTEQRWSTFLPWTQWRHVRHSWYDLAGEHVASQFDAQTKREGWNRKYEERLQIEARTPKAIFMFRDYDGQQITATTHIEEREWRFGTGWCAWLSLFRRPMVKRTLDIDFSDEVGREKGSWKGGTLGHSIEMLPGELHPAAFQRYALKHDLTDVAPTEAGA